MQSTRQQSTNGSGPAPLRVAIIGAGAIGQAVAAYLQQQPLQVTVAAIVAATPRPDGVVIGTTRHAVVQDLPAEGIDLVAECAGAASVAQHVVPALRRGVPCIVVSVGALAGEGQWGDVERAASDGNTWVQPVSGSIGGIDVLSAARLEGLDSVVYEGRKPPHAWAGTPAEDAVDLAALTSPQAVFEGSARDAARLYPRNANVAATTALAGIGLDATRVRLVADPGIATNQHIVRASGAFGEFEISLSNAPMPSNPKTSRLAAMSVARAVLQCAARVRL